MAKHPKPHFVKHNGKWQACYGNQSKGSKFRMQMVIAEGRTLRLALFAYWEALQPKPEVRSPFLPKFIITAWRRLRGKCE